MAYVLPQVQTLEMLKATLEKIRKTGDDGADVSFARLFANHGRGTEEARNYAYKYFTDHTAA